MIQITTLQPIDYLIVGHLAVDIIGNTKRLGGTAAYSALTARAMGLRVGVVTAWGAELPLGPLQGIPIASFPTEKSTTFENIYTPEGRVQVVRHVADRLDYYHIPETWRQPSIVQLGPIAQEVEPSLVRSFSSALIGITPQGWLRDWGRDGFIHPAEWPEAAFVLQRAGAAVVSFEDLDGDEERIAELALHSRVLAVTESDQGARLFWNGDVRRFRAPEVEEVDPTGAGDIFAAVFFARLYSTRDPWAAARLATQVSAISVTRPGLEGIPTTEEINACMVEVI